MAWREGKVFILGAPDLPDAEVRIFSSMSRATPSGDLTI